MSALDLGRRMLAVYQKRDLGAWAGVLTYSAAMSLFPLLLLITVIAGLLVHDRPFERQLVQTLTSVLPAGSRHDILLAFALARRHAAALGLVGLGGMVVTGTGFYGTLESALNRPLGGRDRSLWLRALIAMLGFAVLTAWLLLMVWLGLMLGTGGPAIPPGPGDRLLLGVLHWLVSLALSVGVFSALYRWVPTRRPPWSEAVLGGGLAGLAFQVSTGLFPLYLRWVAHFTSSYGKTFGLMLLVLLWLNLVSQMLMLGAALIAVRTRSEVA